MREVHLSVSHLCNLLSIKNSNAAHLLYCSFKISSILMYLLGNLCYCSQYFRGILDLRKNISLFLLSIMIGL